jgi:two-component system alkaline phosphatase synthesis response regulator PhoP
MSAKKILIVEDDSILQKAIQEYLISDGFEVFTASNGEEGLRFAKTKNPDLILLDIILPKKNGFEVIKEVKADPTIKNVPVILLTNLGSLDDIEKALELGASTYLIKSDYGLEEISQKIKETLNKK